MLRVHCRAMVAMGVEAAARVLRCQVTLRTRRMEPARRVPTMGNHGGLAMWQACANVLEALRNLQQWRLRLQHRHLLRQCRLRLRRQQLLQRLHCLHHHRRLRPLYLHGSRRAISRRFSRISTTEPALGRTSSLTRHSLRQLSLSLNLPTPVTAKKTNASWRHSLGKQATRQQVDGPPHQEALLPGAIASRKRLAVRTAHARSIVILPMLRTLAPLDRPIKAAVQFSSVGTTITEPSAPTRGSLGIRMFF